MHRRTFPYAEASASRVVNASLLQAKPGRNDLLSVVSGFSLGLVQVKGTVKRPDCQLKILLIDHH